MYKITLADGTELNDLVLNGNNFIAQTAVNDAVFKDNMASVTITNLEDGTTEQIEDGVLLSTTVRHGKPCPAPGQKTPDQKWLEPTETPPVARGSGRWPRSMK